MNRRIGALATFALLAALAAPAGLAAEPSKLTVSEVRAIVTAEAKLEPAYMVVHRSDEVVAKGCPAVTSHPQAKPEFAKILKEYAMEARALAVRYENVAREADMLLAHANAYDPADSEKLTNGVNQLAFGLRKEEGAETEYAKALDNAGLDCKGFATQSHDSDALRIEGDKELNAGTSILFALARKP